MENGCKCQECGNLYKIDLMVPNNIWIEIRPENKSEEGGLLCPCCIILKIEKLTREFKVFFLEEEFKSDEELENELLIEVNESRKEYYKDQLKPLSYGDCS